MLICRVPAIKTICPEFHELTRIFLASFVKIRVNSWQKIFSDLSCYVIKMNFTSLPELHEWLAAKGIDTTLWGQLEGTKTVLHLWEEIVAGETFLQDEPPLRIVDAVEIIIRQGDRVLYEVAQEMEGGGSRPRCYPPSEKMKRGETVQQAALRGLNEELGLVAAAITLLPHSYQQRQRQIPSISYPGLNTLYQLHSLEAQAVGLPTDNFTTHEVAGNSHDPVTRHHWAWLRPQEFPVS